MNKLVLVATATLALLATGSAEAREMHRYTTVYGPNGVTTAYTDRVCYDMTCTYNREVTGPYGYSIEREATLTETAPDVYERNATVTGPRGNVLNRNSTLTLY